jgi:transglutaminase-like putative cysteine protease/uncharacterized protein (DUF58 family)
LSWIAVGLLAAAVNTGNNLLYLLLGTLLATLPVSLAQAWWNLSGLSAELRLPPCARAGASFTVVVGLIRRRRGAARWLQVQVVTDRGSYGPAGAEHVPAGSRRELELNGREPHRGPVGIAGVRVGTRFPLGLLRWERFFAAPGEVLVLPALAPAAEARTRLDARRSGTAVSGRAAGQEYDGSRRGRDEEEARRVDWKSTARLGVLMVRETAGETGSRLALELDTRLPGEPHEARRRFERTVSARAGSACRALEAGGVVDLAIDGRSAGTYAGRDGLNAVLRLLARLTPTGEDGRPLPSPAPAPAAAVRAAHDPPAAIHARPRRRRTGSALAAVACGCTALFVYGAIGPAVYAALLLGTILTQLRPALVAGPDGPARRCWNVAGMVGLVVFLSEVFVRGDPLAASSHLAVLVSLYTIFNAIDAGDEPRMVLVSLLHMMLAAALTTEISFVPLLVVWLLAAVYGRTSWPGMGVAGTVDRRRGRLRRHAGPALATTAGVLAAGAVLFVVVPHLGTGAFGATSARRRASGFSEEARLGDIGRIKLDRTPVMQVRVSGELPADGDLRWRGVALYRFDGRRWSRGTAGESVVLPDGRGRFRLDAIGDADPRAELVQEIHLESQSTAVLFAAERPSEIVAEDLGMILRDETGALRSVGKPWGSLTYTVRSVLARRDRSALERAGDARAEPPAGSLELPPLDGRVSALARELTAGAPTRYEAARAIEGWLARTRSYSLDSDAGSRDDPLAAFLFDGMAGHCEYFASAMVVLARAAGIPARFVTGYLRGETNRFNRQYLVRQSDAHAWVEVFFPGAGWIAFDPTPPAGRAVRDERGVADLASDLHATLVRLWDDYCIGIDLDDQVRGLLALRDGLLGAMHDPPRWAALAAAALVAAAAATALSGRRRRRRRSLGPRDVPSFYRGLLARLARHGLRRRPHETPGELAARAAASLPSEAARRIHELTALYYRVRFDRATTEAQVRPLARRLLAELDLTGPS